MLYNNLMEFPSEKFKFKKDRYSKNRGGLSKFLYIACGSCDEPALIYQKDGPGRLLRVYSDRIVWPPELVEEQASVTAYSIKLAGFLACRACSNIIATPMLYEAESRPAYRINHGSYHAYRNPERANANAPDQTSE